MKIFRYYIDSTLEEKINNLPDEIIHKIITYSHPTLDEKTNDLIKNFTFNFSLNVCNRFCAICDRQHRIPMHFRCRI